MSTYNSLEWQNENQLTSFPFTSEIVISDFIVDAHFVQFNNFIPTLNYIYVDTNNIKINITYDEGVIEVMYIKSSYAKHIRMYTPDGHRCLGVLTVGDGAEKLFEGYIGQKLSYSIPFAYETVRSIPSTSGVFTFDRNFGEVSLSRTSTDNTIFYNINTNLNSITLNAVYGHDAFGEAKGLRKINLIGPLNNNITIFSNDIIKFKNPTTGTSGQLSVELVSGDSSKSFTLPTLY